MLLQLQELSTTTETVKPLPFVRLVALDQPALLVVSVRAARAEQLRQQPADQLDCKRPIVTRQRLPSVPVPGDTASQNRNQEGGSR